MATYWIYPIDRVFQDNGDLAPGAEAYIDEPGTETPKTVYKDSALTIAHPRPIVADAFGVFPAVYIDGAGGVRIDIRYNGVSLAGYPRDKVAGFPIGGLGADSVPFNPTTRIDESTTQAAIVNVDRKVEVDSAANDLIVTTGSSNAYLLNTAVSDYALATKDVHLLQASFANTGACTLNVDSTGAKSLKYMTGGSKTDPASNEILTGHILRVFYDGTDFVIVDQWRPTATQAEAEAGTAEGVGMTPLRTAQAITAQAMVWTEGTEQATTSGTSVDFNGLPDDIVEIIFHLDQVSTSGNDALMIQIGDSGGLETSGYNGGAYSGAPVYNSSGFLLTNGAATAGLYSGQVSLVRMAKSAFKWTLRGDLGANSPNGFNSSGGSKTLSARLDRLRFTTSGGSDTFDAGSVNISYVVAK